MLYNIEFKFKDPYTKGNWKKQRCTVESLEECINIYGLEGDDVEYEITKIEEVKSWKDI